MRPDHKRKEAILAGKLPPTKPTTYVSLLVLAVAFGYFIASYFNSSSPTTIAYNPITAATNMAAVSHSSVWDRDFYLFTYKCSDPVGPDQVRQVIQDQVYNGSSPYDNFPPAFSAKHIKPSSIVGWGSTGAVFENLIKRVRPRTIIEVGSFVGASATHMAQIANRLGLETQIVCLDDFRAWPGFRIGKFKDIANLHGEGLILFQFLQNVKYLNVTGSIVPVPFSSSAGLDNLCEWGVFADLIEVDAGHDFHSAWADINRAYKLLRPGGTMFGHDYFMLNNHYGVRRAVHLFAQVHGFEVRVDGEHWVIDPK